MDNFVLATDYKFMGFSAVFSFECAEEAIDEMSRSDLLHAYMVGTILMSEHDEYESLVPVLEQPVAAIKNVIKGVKKKTGKSFDAMISKTMEKISKMYPVETEEIRTLLKSDSNKITFCSFFLPQILNDVTSEYSLTKKSKHIAVFPIEEFSCNENSVTPKAIAVEMSSVLFEQDQKTNLTNKEKKQREQIYKVLKETLKLSLVSSGELEQYTKKNVDSGNAQTGSTAEAS